MVIIWTYIFNYHPKLTPLFNYLFVFYEPLYPFFLSLYSRFLFLLLPLWWWFKWWWSGSRHPLQNESHAQQKRRTWRERERKKERTPLQVCCFFSLLHLFQLKISPFYPSSTVSFFLSSSSFYFPSSFLSEYFSLKETEMGEKRKKNDESPVSKGTLSGH